MSEQGAVAHLAYDWMIVTYFFFGGLSAGTYLFSVAANYLGQEFRSMAKKGAILTPIALAIGLFVLFLDLGQPFRVWRLFLAFNVHSPVSWGVWFLNIFMLISFIYAVLLLMGKDNVAKKVGFLGIPFAILAATYTAMLLAHAPARLLWHTSLLPVMFLNGGIISGIALVMLLSATTRNTEQITKLGRFVAWLIVLELGMVFAEVIILINGGTESVAAAKTLFSGRLGYLFLGFEIFLGSVVPIAILLKNKTSIFLHVVASILILIGIFSMRYVIVVGGQLI